MRVIQDKGFDSFDTLEVKDDEEKKKIRRKIGYKEHRGLVSVSKIKIEDEKIFEVLEKARADYLKKNTDVREKYFGIQNMVLILVKEGLKNIDSLDEIKEKEYKTGKSIKRHIVVSFRNEERATFDKLSRLAEERRNKLNLYIRGFGVSNVILILVIDELIKRKYLK